MGRVRLKRNDLPKIIRRLPEEMDRAVDKAGDELVPMIMAAVRHRTGNTARSTKNSTPGELHTTVGVGVPGGQGFYVRFWEWGTSSPNLFGIVVPAEGRVGRTAAFFIPVYVDRLSAAVRRACS